MRGFRDESDLTIGTPNDGREMAVPRTAALLIVFFLIPVWICASQLPRQTHRETLFEILLNQTEIRLYLPCTDWFGTANGQCPFAVRNHSEKEKNNPISQDFSACRLYKQPPIRENNTAMQPFLRG